MPAVLEWQGADQSGNPFVIGESGALVNFTRDPDWSVDRLVSLIPAGQASIERNVRARFSGNVTSITNVRFWRSDLNVLSAGVTVTCGGLADGNGVPFSPPSTAMNSDAALPTSEQASNAALNATVGKEADGYIYAPRLASGEARWLRLQVKTSAMTPGGDIAESVPHFQCTIKYTEN